MIAPAMIPAGTELAGSNRRHIGIVVEVVVLAEIRNEATGHGGMVHVRERT